MDEKQIGQSIKKEGLSPLYIFASSDRYLLRKAADTVREQCLPCETVRLCGGDLDLQSLFESFNSSALFGAERTLYIFDGDSLSDMSSSDRSELSALLSDIPEHITFVITCLTEERKPAISKDVEKLCGGKGLSFIIDSKQGQALYAEMDRIAKSYGASIEKNASARLCELCGTQLSVLEREIEKLAAFCGYGSITVLSINTLASKTTEAGVFDIIKAMTSKDASAAMTALGIMLSNRQEPISIASALNSNYINYYRALLVKTGGGTLDDLYSLYGYRKTDVKPKIAYERCRSYSLPRLEAIIGVLAKLDRELKSSRSEPSLLLETAVAKIMTI